MNEGTQISATLVIASQTQTLLTRALQTVARASNLAQDGHADVLVQDELQTVVAALEQTLKDVRDLEHRLIQFNLQTREADTVDAWTQH